MPYIEVRGKYRTFRYDGTTPLDFTTYNNLLCVVRRPNPTTFITLQQYVPGQGGPFTTFLPGSSYTIVTKADGTQGSFNFDIGPYTRVDRLPSSTFIKSPNFYIGLDKNSIVVPISSYALSVNSPLSSIVNIVYTNGQGNRLQYVYADNFKTGAPLNFTHMYPNSGYELRNRIPFTFFAPLQSEMGDAWATGYNQTGQLGMGYQYDSYGYTQLYGNWDKVVSSSTHSAALSTCGTKKKLFVCGDNSYSQLGLTPLIGYTTQRAVTAIQTVWTEVKNLYYHVWDPTCEGGCYYEDALANETIQDVEVGDHFTLVKTDQYLYGIGNMYALGIAPPGDPSCCPQFENGYNNTDPVTNYYYNTFLKYFTRFLRRSTSTLFASTTISINDQTLYNEIQSSRLQKFQARGPRWWALYDNKFYACGKIGGTGASLNISSGPIIPMGLTVGSLNNNTTFREIFALNNPVNWNKTYTDFEASRSTLVALSSDNKRWLIGGRRANTLYMTSLSTMCFYDSQQNSYVPQNDYGLRLFPTIYGAMGIKDGTLYFTPNPVNTGSGGSYIFGLGGNKTISDMPLTSLPKINTALSPNPDEQVGTRSLVPVRYINPNSPNVSWKSLFVGFSYSCATDGNNKFYICGSNSVGQLGLQQFPIDESSLVYTLSNVIPDNVYNVNANDNSAVIYKTNRNPAPSFTPVPSMTPTPTPTPAVIYPQTNGARMVHFLGATASGRVNSRRRLRCFYSNDFDNWTLDTQFANSAFHGIIFDPQSGTALEDISFGRGCIPTGAAFTASTRTLYINQGFGATWNFIAAKSDNTAGNGTYNTFIEVPLFNLDNTTDILSPYYKNQYFSYCFWDSNNQNMVVVYRRLYSNGFGTYAFTYNPVNNTYTNPIQIVNISPANNTTADNFSTFYNSENILRTISNGIVYFSQINIGGSIAPWPFDINIYTYNRAIANYHGNWGQITYRSTRPSHAPASGQETPCLIRLSYWKDGTPVIGYVYVRRRSDGSNGPLANLYINLQNNGVWTEPVLAAQALPWTGGYTNLEANGQILDITGHTTCYDMYVHPLENLLHIIYVTDTQSTDNKVVNDVSANCKIRLKKINRQGVEVSDTLIFDASVGALVVNGYIYSYAGCLNYFYKSTNSNEFIPYFGVLTTDGRTGGAKFNRIFKYINGSFTQIYSVNYTPMGVSSGPLGTQVNIIT